MPIGGFIADFVCHAARLIVEIDGGQHDPSSESEASRTRFLEGEGYRVLRFWNNEVLDNPEGVRAAIAENLHPVTPTRIGPVTPAPTLPHQGGGPKAPPGDAEKSAQPLLRGTSAVRGRPITPSPSRGEGWGGGDRSTSGGGDAEDRSMVKKAPSAAAGEGTRNSHRGGGPKATTTEDPADPAQLIADLQRQLAECRAERDEALEYQTATRFTHPPPRWGRVGVGVTDRLAVGVMPRTDPW